MNFKIRVACLYNSYNMSKFQVDDFFYKLEFNIFSLRDVLTSLSKNSHFAPHSTFSPFVFATMSSLILVAYFCLVSFPISFFSLFFKAS